MTDQEQADEVERVLSGIIWVCWDLSNRDGRTYLWAYPTYRRALARYQRHKRRRSYAILKRPEKMSLERLHRDFETDGIAKNEYYWLKR